MFITKITNQFGVHKIALCDFVILIIVLFFMANVMSKNILILLAFPYGLVIGTLMPILNVMVIKAVPKKIRGTANAMYYAAIDSGFGIGSLSWGMVAEALGGYNLIFLIASIIAIVGMIVYILSERKLSKKVIVEYGI
ncbi:MFS transporter [Clostridium vincentii]|uniref:Putative transporter n=1 Tax=Clostridium vincentii TaxID=52704 RepID=A0A2T0BHH9_9CLOT|nr:MFS transporter [Clostridium vincentii]PRR83361.1 putative transporter [Clostridium vincentii]